ncbi:signal peptidase II [Nitratiruptor sp. YY08-26]|uniref:signal peptidase II n=1 Tax=unclassified Nitratiruptor TaxID=2624044 RepID=UPI0019367717|nr:MULTISPECIES: signal peptidase II [unclassified Nitratiruptor]BCD61249.1 signal peptidase II [Nitratiruptor sp. YY08-13]BCD65182.1 signal peptidase II [Nitratiruptor sp. YY08-26]
MFAFILMVVGVFFIDRAIKDLFLQGFYWESRCITLGYVLNKGVAFSMFAFLGTSLKWILLVLVIGAFIYVWRERMLQSHPLLFGILFGAALGNLYDRFVYGGVIDYVYWHCWFDFAIFNFADVMIDVAVGLLVYLHFRKK